MSESDQNTTDPGNASQPTPIAGLSPDDAAVVDALFDRRALGVEAGPLPIGGGERVTRWQRLLNLLHSIGPERITADPEADEAAICSLLALVSAERERETENTPTPITRLSPADGEALDALIAAGGSRGPVPPGLGERAERVGDVLGLLDQWEPAGMADDGEADEALVARTVRAAADARQRERFAEQVQMVAQPPPSLGVGLRQVATAAAVFLLAASLLLPVLERNRTDAQRLACAASLASAGAGMSRYAADHDGVLPRGPAIAGDPWTHVGQPSAVTDDGRFQSNSAHLYILIRSGYLDHQQLACPTNADATENPIALGQIDWHDPKAVSYSYQNQYAPNVIRVDTSRTDFAVLADKNPLFVVRDGRIVFDQTRTPNAASPGHDRSGQNVLLLDGSAKWTLSPTVGDDHIWIIQGKTDHYHGNEHPTDAGSDSFLVP